MGDDFTVLSQALCVNVSIRVSLAEDDMALGPEVVPEDVSTHVSLAGGDGVGAPGCLRELVSTHVSLAGGDDNERDRRDELLNVSTHVFLAGGDLRTVRGAFHEFRRFNPRLPCGRRR